MVTLGWWSLAAVFALWVGNLPPCELCAIVFGVGFLVSCVIVTWRQEWGQVWRHRSLFVINVPVLFGNQAAYVAAFRYAPPEHVELLYYLWPILVVCGTGLLPRERFSFTQPLAAVLGFAGVYFLLMRGNPQEWSRECAASYFLAFFAGFLWAGYTLYSRTRPHTPPMLLGLACGPCSLACFFLHGLVEFSVAPSPFQWVILTVWGTGILGTSLASWEYGVKKGFVILLGVFSYCVPMVSIGWLIAFGWTKSAPSLWIACALVFSGSVLSSLCTWVERRWAFRFMHKA